jgi:predicted DNA-binding protein
MPSEPKDAQMAYRIPMSLKNELQNLADADKRKLGPYVQLVLEEHVAAKTAGKTRGKSKRPR